MRSVSGRFCPKTTFLPAAKILRHDRLNSMSDSESDAPFDEFGEGGDDAKVSAEALKKLRAEAPAEDLDDAAAEFDEPAPTAIDDGSIARLALLEKPQLAETDGDSGAHEFDDDSVTVMDPNALGSDSAEDEAIGKEACPKCGVMVLAGYPKCPRCKTSLVAEKKTREQAAAGGTSLIGRTVPWTVVIIAAILTAIIVYLSEREVQAPDLDPADPAPTETSTPAEP